jgi:hypothetical protein
MSVARTVFTATAAFSGSIHLIGGATSTQPADMFDPFN